MIKRYIIVALVIQVSSLYAILGGIGVNFMQNSYSDTASVFNAPSNLSQLGSITRSEMKSPIGGGVFAYITAIPFVDLEAEYNVSYSSYSYSYTGGTNSESGVTLPEISPLTIPMWTYGGSLSVQRKIFKFPTIRILAGAGISTRNYSNVISFETVQELDLNKLDPTVSENFKHLKDALESDEAAMGFHLELRARFKPPIIPFSLNANLRYNFIKDFLPDVKGFLTISAGFAFAI